MKNPETPELTVLHSEIIGAELAYSGRELTPSSEDLIALTERLGVKTPDSITAMVMRASDVKPPGEEATPTGVTLTHSAGGHELSPYDDGVLPIPIGEFSERNILHSFAYSLLQQAQFKKSMTVLKTAAALSMVGLGGGSIAQTLGSNWGYAGFAVTGAALGGAWLWSRSQRNAPPIEVPNLDGLESPIKITKRPV
jgi:hypothetical protein